jgi:hypothetical protein
MWHHYFFEKKTAEALLIHLRRKALIVLNSLYYIKGKENSKHGRVHRIHSSDMDHRWSYST